MMQKDRQRRLPDLSEIMDILVFNLAVSRDGKNTSSKEQKPLRQTTGTGRSTNPETPKFAPHLVPLFGLLLLAAGAALFFILALHRSDYQAPGKEITTDSVSENK
ncbi:MAG: hypothetical protein SFV17_12045 [Candidatus Obscuribacter sp.]|nr:hypothetical protein [Candidatus Obscuribacter sp.]